MDKQNLMDKQKKIVCDTVRNKKFIIVSNRLPIYRDPKSHNEWHHATGGLVTALDPVLRSTNGMWVGWDGLSRSQFSKDDFEVLDIRNIHFQDDVVSESKGFYRISNIPLTTDEVHAYYSGFSNSSLWGLFHYFFEKCSFDLSAWKAYYDINLRFAHHVHSITQPDDIIWVHDYHLMLVPYFLRKMRKTQQIHFFLHIPFPHDDIFSILPWKNDILHSLLCCNSVGLHHKQYRRNILEAFNAYRRELIDAGASPFEDSYKTRFYVNPISIDFNSFESTAKKTSVLNRKKEIIEQNAGKKIILGVDRLDYSKGIKERLLALEYLLEKHTELIEKFCYFQIAVPSREDVDAYRILKKEIDEIVGRINGKFATGSWSPIHYIYNTLPFEELVAFYSAADIGLVTPLRDGMNLVCKEFVASHVDGDGVLILSKFAGARAEIKNCLVVNPYSISDIADTIYQALSMSQSERRTRMGKMRKNIRYNNIELWLNNCFEVFEFTMHASTNDVHDA
jgi:alpha,alpha-trehalose-phosphate synthase [UDP-forming]